MRRSAQWPRALHTSKKLVAKGVIGEVSLVAHDGSVSDRDKNNELFTSSSFFFPQLPLD